MKPIVYSGNLFSRMLQCVERPALTLATLFTLAIFTAQAAQTQTLTVLHTFTGGPADGANPFAGLVRGAGGILYGTTNDGGRGQFCPHGCGTVFKVDTTGKERVLYNFAGAKDGAYPYYGSLVHDAAGDLYGTTYEGGTSGAGTVFTLSRAGTETVLHRFKGGADGRFPWAALIRDAAGNLYGTTSGGGSLTACPYGCGTVFRVNTSGKETVLHAFTGGTDGAYPLGGLVRDAAGNLYGTTEAGGSGNCGSSGCGTVFRVDTHGNETVLYTFTGPPDGQFPLGSLISDGAGNLYGTTVQGGAFGSGGTVFKVDATGKETVLHSFNLFGGDGGIPYAGLVLHTAGNLYGTTSSGGDSFGGTIFEVDASGNETVLYSFTGGTDGYSPYGGLLRDPTGNLYGTAFQGGDASCFCGTVFELTP